MLWYRLLIFSRLCVNDMWKAPQFANVHSCLQVLSLHASGLHGFPAHCLFKRFVVPSATLHSFLSSVQRMCTAFNSMGKAIIHSFPSLSNNQRQTSRSRDISVVRDNLAKKMGASRVPYKDHTNFALLPVVFLGHLLRHR